MSEEYWNQYQFVAGGLLLLLLVWVLDRLPKPASAKTQPAAKSEARIAAPADQIREEKKSRLVANMPVGFGYKMFWFAVSAGAEAALLQALFVKSLQSCGWKAGVAAAYAGQVFVSPVVDGWVLVVGSSLPNPDSEAALLKLRQVLMEASREGGQAQYFASNRITEQHCWMKAEAGKLVRGYAYSGEQGEVLLNEGTITQDEPANLLVASLLIEVPDEEKFVVADEELVMHVAGRWSINPSELEDRVDLSLGVGKLGMIHLD